MTDQREPEFAGEVIDLRVLILTAWRAKWVILGATLLAGLVAFLVSSYLVPARYQATAFVTVTEYEKRADLEPYGLPELAESDELRTLTFEALGITDPDNQRSFEFSAILQGRAQVQLEVTAEDPALAAKTANIWAGVVFERINEVYGTGEETLKTLENEVSKAETSWSAAQSALEEYLLDSPLETYPVLLSSAQSSLAEYLQEIDHNQLLIIDAGTLQAQIEDMNSAETLNPGIAISLITLQGRATAVQVEPPLQIQVDQKLNLDLSPAEGLAILQRFGSALESQNLQLVGEISVLEDEISDLAQSLEIEQHQVEQLTLKRDLARTTYTALAQQLDDFRITQNEEDLFVKISASALSPEDKISPDILAATGFAGMSAALLTILGILFYDWWVGRAKD